MKKGLFVCFLLFFLFLFNFNVFAIEYMGINQVNPSCINYEIVESEDGTKVIVNMDEPIPVKEGVEYFILPTYVNKEEFLSSNKSWELMPLINEGLTIHEYFEGEFMDEVFLVQKLYSNGIFVGYRYLVNYFVSEIKLNNLFLESQYVSKSEFSDVFENDCKGKIDCMLLIIEAERINELPTAKDFQYEYSYDEYTDITDLYLGENLSLFAYGNNYPEDLAPVLDSEEYFIETSVNDPITIEEMRLLVGLTAWDEVDGDITDRIEIVDDSNYIDEVVNVDKIQDRKLGVYPIVFSVSDTAGNSATCVINIEVLDITPPIIDEKNSKLNYINEFDGTPISDSKILSNIIAIDNYGDVIKEIIDNEYQGNENILGTYKVTVRCKDPSGNYSDVEVEIKNIDSTAPVITSATTEYETSYTEKLSTETILEAIELSIYDNHDGSLTYEIITNEYENNKSIVGVYLIKIKATDSSGNESTFELTVNVVDDVEPGFLINKNVVIVKAGSFVDTNEIKRILETRKLTQDKNFEIEVVEDGYSENYKKPGNYEVKLKITYNNGDCEYQLLKFNVLPNENHIEKISFLEKVWEIIKIIFQCLWNIISWPFIKLFSWLF
ncbi:MAG TPA: hypothetical protein GXZ48_04865 [Acholeplasmataceae bacterium]|nr:hypothetical protein [Acholeplasmataceae bacterium]